MPRRLFVLGGGGFSMEEPSVLDDYLFSLVPADAQQRPRVCFVPTATGDSPTYVDRFLAAFGSRAETSVLQVFPYPPPDVTDLLVRQDIVYVGGGSTANLLALWRLHGIDQALRAAYDAGVVLTGVSAGMNCWFEASITDSFSEHLDPLLDGLGLLTGGACPHYDGEERRRPRLREVVAGGFPATYAADDGVGLFFEDESFVEAVSSRAGGDAYRVSLVDDVVDETPLGARVLTGAPPR